MLYKRLFMTALLCLGVSTITLAQGNEQTDLRLMKEAEGTYQIQIIDSRQYPEVTPQMIREIEKNRDKNKEVVIRYMPDIRIIILPESVINSPDFVAPKKYVFVRTTKN